jgi:hypothetical protein
LSKSEAGVQQAWKQRVVGVPLENPREQRNATKCVNTYRNYEMVEPREQLRMPTRCSPLVSECFCNARRV